MFNTNKKLMERQFYQHSNKTKPNIKCVHEAETQKNNFRGKKNGKRRIKSEKMFSRAEDSSLKKNFF